MIQVLIERQIADGQIPSYEKFVREALQQSYTASGFISGEVFVDINNEHHRYVLCKWRTIEDWNRWYQSSDRLQIMNLISPLLISPERISVLQN